jgi:hypothetical protein
MAGAGACGSPIFCACLPDVLLATDVAKTDRKKQFLRLPLPRDQPRGDGGNDRSTATLCSQTSDTQSPFELSNRTIKDSDKR